MSITKIQLKSITKIQLKVNNKNTGKRKLYFEEKYIPLNYSWAKEGLIKKITKTGLINNSNKNTIY